jgi:hypothetical protein
MALLRCLCGDLLSNTNVPSSTGIIVSASLLHDGPANSNASVAIWECDKCGRFAVINPDGLSAKWYRPENNLPGNILRVGANGSSAAPV